MYRSSGPENGSYSFAKGGLATNACDAAEGSQHHGLATVARLIWHCASSAARMGRSCLLYTSPSPRD
eukprot:5289209-Alexandrium_andersonii.AAC.1